jgi:chemotaxis protein methyltransferase CheR
MRFGEPKRYYIERRLQDRIQARGSPSYRDYFAILRSDPNEAATVIDSCTVNETYFYREVHQLRCLSQDILPELARAKCPGDKIRIWSQPCSTGEEPYSIALWLLENWPMVDAYNVEIIGSDIDGAALAAAQAGRYGPRSLARLPEAARRSYFRPSPGGEYTIISDIRESVIFTHTNLIDHASMMANGTFDVIFCRNVLIYFDEASQVTAADNLFDCLQPGGFLCLGHTESMSRIDDRFAARRFVDAIVYRRPAG